MEKKHFIKRTGHLIKKHLKRSKRAEINLDKESRIIATRIGNGDLNAGIRKSLAFTDVYIREVLICP